jgi:hypothetical protein
MGFLTFLALDFSSPAVMEISENRLVDVVDLNEMAKKVVRLAADIELMSMNALLANKSSGSRSGFSAVSLELRDFSLEVIEGVENLSGLFSEMISLVAGQMNLARRSRIFAEVLGNSHKAGGFIGVAQSRVNGCRDAATKDFVMSARRAYGLISRIENQCLVGGGLSRVGKIEATYSGAREGMLYQIAQDVGVVISDIFNNISELKGRMKEYSS